MSTEVGDNPSDKIAIGIIDSKNRERYVQDDANLWHGFKIKKDGNYRIFVENYGTKRNRCRRLLRYKSIYNKKRRIRNLKKVINTIVFVICIVLLSVNVEADEITVSDQIVDEGFVEETEDGLITLSSSQINIIWTVNAKIIKKTKGFKLKAGDEIVINIKVSPEKKKQG